MKRKGANLRYETIGGVEIPYFWDDRLGLWLSLADHSVEAGRNAVAYAGFLRPLGAPCTTTHGFLIPKPAKMGWIAFQDQGGSGVSNFGLRIWSNGSTVAELPWVSRSGVTTDIDIAVGTLSFQTYSLGFPSTPPDRPNVRVGMRWKLP